MPLPIDFRPVLAAGLLLAGLAGAYQAALRLPHPAGHAGLTLLPEPSARGPVGNPVLASTRPLETGLAVSAPGSGQGQAASSLGAAESSAPPCRPQPLRLTETSFAGPRRYVGMVGGEWATAELDDSRPDSLSGRFYLWRSGQEHEFSQSVRHRPRVLVLSKARYPQSYRAGGQWRLNRLPGTVLQGNWVDSTGRQPRPFALRESYRGGVHYDVRHLSLTGGEPASPDSCDVPSNTYEFLHLLGPAATRLPLRRVQCPQGGARRRQLLADYNHETRNEYLLSVKLNDFNLLSYQLDYSDSPFEGTGGFATINVLLDLKTGRRLTVASQLRENYELPLRRLLARRLLSEPLVQGDHGEDNPERYGWEQLRDQGRLVKLPYLHDKGGKEETRETDTWVLCAQGLKIGEHLNAYLVTITYPELRPLVRPGTPLARMLQARGLW